VEQKRANINPPFKIGWNEEHGFTRHKKKEDITDKN